MYGRQETAAAAFCAQCGTKHTCAIYEDPQTYPACGSFFARLPENLPYPLVGLMAHSRRVPPPASRIALGPRIPAPKAPSDEGAVKRLFEAS